MAHFQIKEPFENSPPQAYATFEKGEEALHAEWRQWLTDHGVPLFERAWEHSDGTFDDFCWLLNEDVYFSYKMRWG